MEDKTSRGGMRNMTEGSPAGHIFYFALPLLAGSFLQQLYNMVDSWVAVSYTHLYILGGHGGIVLGRVSPALGRGPVLPVLPRGIRVNHLVFPVR